MGKEQSYRILIGGGGTGGHVFPAIAIADALKEMHPGAEFLFVGARGRLEMEKVPEAGYAIEGLPVAGFQRRLTLKNISFFQKLATSMLKSRRIVRHFNPDVAVGVGGYASGPILKAAARRGIPILIQEQNSYAGVTNRLLARSARTICVAYEGMERYFPAGKIHLTGNPIRQHLVKPSSERTADLKEFGLQDGRKTCMVVGGSLGARTLNRSLLGGLEKLGRGDLQLIWQCGKNSFNEIEEQVARSGLKNVRVLPFISRMDRAYGAADVIVSRAGAISISELCVIGKPVILVPSPNVAEDHQTKNAEALSGQNAAVMIPDQEAEAGLVDAMLELLGDDGRQQELSENIKQLGITNAAERIAAEVTKLMETK
ncbi:MAG: undecaprenyldiphospho-muramoylpentapeptide beta-N-acetylglucosaminyltransferase [Bacteroidetes bacterium]|nr:undecaprenyldiphospho-muramoylpentapeptide beta-N-acetylglucosaminyltransferase [Bacteroidota bacterium]